MGEAPVEGRVAKRRRRVRTVLGDTGHQLISAKGVDGATMFEIAELADVGAGTIYGFFKSEDELAIAVIEKVMRRLAERIKTVTDTFADPSQNFAYGVRKVMEAATGDPRWRHLLDRCEVIPDALQRCMGPFALRDLRRTIAASHSKAVESDLIWKMSTYTILGVSLAVVKDELPPTAIKETLGRLLCIAGVEIGEACELAARPRPELLPE